jgi:nicotinamide mononucleotide transporter
VLTKTVFEILGEPVTWAELAGFVTGIACVALAVAQRIETFPIGIVNNVFFIVLFADARLYADMALQVVYLALGVMGWWVWFKRTHAPLEVSRASLSLLASTTVAVIAATLILVPILRSAHGAAPGWGIQGWREWRTVTV